MKTLARLSRVAVLVLTTAFVLSTAYSQTSTGPQTSDTNFQRSFPITSGGTLVVSNFKGTVHITGSNTNQVTVNVNKTFEGSDRDRQWWMANTHVDFHNTPERVEVEVQYPSYNCWSDCNDHDNYYGAVELTIQVPRHVNLEVKGHKPEIKISSIDGDVAIKSYKSPIQIQSTSGAIHIDTFKDSVTLSDVAIRGALDLKTVKGEALIDARSLGDQADLETEKGSIVIRVPQNAGIDVDYSGGRKASFHSDFPVSSTVTNYPNEVRGTINQGGTHMRLRSEKGSISLEQVASR